jgi:hypothetical protein
MHTFQLYMNTQIFLRPCTENENIVNTWRIRKFGIVKLRAWGLPDFTIRVYSAEVSFRKPVH